MNFVIIAISWREQLINIWKYLSYSLEIYRCIYEETKLWRTNLNLCKVF